MNFIENSDNPIAPCKDTTTWVKNFSHRLHKQRKSPSRGFGEGRIGWKEALKW